MSKIITQCSICPDWIENALTKIAQSNDTNQPDLIETNQLPEQLIDPVEWANGTKKPVNIHPSVRKIVHDAISDITTHYHKQIPLGDIFNVLANNNLIPIQEDGTRWSGLLIGGHECGTEKAKDQRANIPLVMKNKGEWSLTTSDLILSYCKMPSGNYEIVCYLS